MRPEAEDRFVLRKVGRRDVALLVVALVFVHTDKLICKCDRVRWGSEDFATSWSEPPAGTIG